MSSRLNPLTARGDTLIEVLLAIAVVSSLLGGAYLSANRSLNGTQVSKERDSALRVAETQVERIRGYKSVTSVAIPNGSCIDSTLTTRTNSGGGPGALTSDQLNPGSPSQYNAECIVDSTSTKYVAGVEDINYNVYTLVSGADYTIYVRWLRSGGGENQEVIIRYRAY